MFNRFKIFSNSLGNALVYIFHTLALFCIGAATIWAAAYTFLDLFNQSRAGVGDLLLLFIYLEIGAMVGIYFKTNHMPVRFLLYIAITALTRHMVDLMSRTPVNILEMLSVAGSTVAMAACVFIVRYTSAQFPSENHDDSH